MKLANDGTFCYRCRKLTNYCAKRVSLGAAMAGHSIVYDEVGKIHTVYELKAVFCDAITNLANSPFLVNYQPLFQSTCTPIISVTE